MIAVTACAAALEALDRGDVEGARNVLLGVFGGAR